MISYYELIKLYSITLYCFKLYMNYYEMDYFITYNLQIIIGYFFSLFPNLYNLISHPYKNIVYLNI